VQPVTPAIAESLGMKKAEGALVDQPRPHSPAADAGIKVGDVITAVDDQPIKDPRTLVQKIADAAPGTHVRLAVLRNSEAQTVDLTLGEMPRQQQANASTQENAPQQNAQQSKGETGLGLDLAPAQSISGAGDKGVVVLGVDPGSPAAENGMQTGDIIMSVSGKSVSRPADVRQAIERSRSEGKQAVLMRVQTQNGTRFVAIPTGKG
jgi:serine protease Do